MTGNEIAKPDGKSPEAKRQEARRKRLEEGGFKEVATVMGPGDLAMLEEARTIRGGVNGPYEVAEYLAALVREDHARLQGQLIEARQYPCRQCGKTLPRGCGGAFKGELACLHTPTAWKFEIPQQLEA